MADTQRRWLLSLAIGVVAALTGWVSPAHAEMYVAAQGGYTIPNGLSSVKGTGPTSGQTTSDLDQINSPLLGFKIGYFFPSLPWLGVEGDFYYTTPHVKQQLVDKTATNPLTGTKQTFSVLTPGFHMTYMNATANVIARYPGKRFQPYAGGGIGMAYGRISGVQTTAAGNPNPVIESQSDVSVVFNALVGTRYFLTKHVALFGEYKYTTTSFDWGGNVLIKADYTAHNLVGGVSFHF
jgi:opacity protein-like surface antigen